MLDYNKLINSIPEGLSQLEIARFLYIELGRYFIYDYQFIEADDIETKKEIFKRGINDIYNNRVVCSSLSEIYVNLLKRCGINAEVQYISVDKNKSNDVGHAFVRLYVDGKVGSADLIRDLTNIKVGFKTEYFLPKLTEEEIKEKGRLEDLKHYLFVDEDEIRKIDEKIGYTYKRNVFK